MADGSLRTSLYKCTRDDATCIQIQQPFKVDNLFYFTKVEIFDMETQFLFLLIVHIYIIWNKYWNRK